MGTPPASPGELPPSCTSRFLHSSPGLDITREGGQISAGDHSTWRKNGVCRRMLSVVRDSRR